MPLWIHLVMMLMKMDKCKFGLCLRIQIYCYALSRKKASHTLLDVAFSEGESIAFFTKGSGSVHLTGNLIPDDPDYPFGGLGDEEEMNEDEEISDEEESEKAGAKKKQTTKQVKAKKAAAEEDEDESDKDDDEDVDMSLLNEDSDDDDEDDDDDDDDEEDEEEDEDDDEDDDEDEEETSVPPAKADKSSKQKQQNGLPNGKGPKEEKAKQKNQKDPKEQKQQPQQQQQQQKTPNQPQKQQPQQGQKKTLGGGVMIEDLRVGKGPEAKAGKKVQVYYEGRLKSNNKVFDSTKGGDGFKFILGKGEVIRGWDIGVQGMKVGSKRRIVCPPNAAYGHKGSPPVIPPNATLVFDVELRGVN